MDRADVDYSVGVSYVAATINSDAHRSLIVSKSGMIGKPVSLGGSLGRKEATGRGVALVTAELLKRLRRPLSETTVAIQGYGNVGSATATILDRMGCQIVAVSDISGGLYAGRGCHFYRPGTCALFAVLERYLFFRLQIQ